MKGPDHYVRDDNDRRMCDFSPIPTARAGMPVSVQWFERIPILAVWFFGVIGRKPRLFLLTLL